MAEPLLIKDILLPAIYLEANMMTSKALKLLTRENIGYGVVGDVRGESFGMVTRKSLYTVKANMPVQDIITKELHAVHTQQDTSLDNIIKSYQENLRLNPDLLGFVLIDKGLIQGILLRESVEKQALQIAVDQVGRDAQELYRRNIDSLQEYTAKYRYLSQCAPDLPNKAAVTERDEIEHIINEIEHIINEKQQLGIEVDHLQRNVEEMRLTLQSLRNQQITSLEIQHLSLSVQDLREQLERLSRDERRLNGELDGRILLAHRLTGPSVGTDPNPTPKRIKVQCPICHEKGEVQTYNPRHPPICKNKHPMNPVV